MVMHPVAEGRFEAAVEKIAKLDLLRAPPRSIRVIEEEFELKAAGRMPTPLIERYRDRLPLGAGDPVVTLMEGSTPLIHAPRLSERLGIETHLKFEGMNPTGSFKDRGMTRRRLAGEGRAAPRRSSAPRPATRPRAPPPTRPAPACAAP